LFSLPLLAFLLWVAVTRGLRPLVKLTREVARREPDNLVPLNAGAAPREVVPLIEHLNRLFGRIDISLQKNDVLPQMQRTNCALRLPQSRRRRKWRGQFPEKRNVSMRSTTRFSAVIVPPT